MAEPSGRETRSRSVIVIALVLIVLGALMAIGPWTVFPVCNQGDSTMRCHYTAEAEIVVGSMVVLFALMLIFTRRSESWMVIGLGEAALGVWAILVPVYLIGMCNSSTMECRTIAEPILIFEGLLTIMISLYLVLKGWRARSATI